MTMFDPFVWDDSEEPPAGAGKPCMSVPCPSFRDAVLDVDDTFVPTLTEVRQAGAPYAGPDDRFYVERNGRVVLLSREDFRS